MRLAFSKFLACALCLNVFVANQVFAEFHEWQGFYAGLNVGCGFLDAHAKTSTQFSPTGYFAASSVVKINQVGSFDLHSTGFEGGAQIGFNWQSNNVIVGLETEIDAFLLSAKKSITVIYPCCAPTAFTLRQSVKTDWLYTLRPRLGFAWGRWMVYGTGGLSLTNIKYKETFTDTFASAFESASKKRTQIGWCLGAGLEYAIFSSMTVRAEYLHTEFEKIRVNSNNLTAFVPPIAFPTNAFSHSVDLKADIVRFGINYSL